MNFLFMLKKFWRFLKEDTWQSWLVSLILAFAVIKFIFFPALSLVTGAPLPLVVVESCSMYHSAGFEGWWDSNAAWYENSDISKDEFEEFSFKNGLNKGDIILVYGRGDYRVGDIIIFESDFKFPLIHRVVDENGGNSLGTKGDNNFDQLPQERNIQGEDIYGKAAAKVPGLGWVKLIFFEHTKPKSQRGFCK